MDNDMEKVIKQNTENDNKKNELVPQMPEQDKEKHASKIEQIEQEMKEFQDTLVQEESIRVQKAKWVREQVEKQREIEDATRARIEEEQKLLDEMKRSTEDHLERTKELRKFNDDTRAQMRQQVYELNGITEDKLQGMKEYKNAYYQGMALAFFVLSVGLVGLSAFLHGFESQLCLFLVAFTGIEGALLSQESKRGRFMEAVCRFLYILMFPAMLVIFVCYELQFPQYEVLLPYFVMAGCVVLVLGTFAYFVYNPYRGVKKKLRSVKEDLKEIEDEAEKAVRRNQKRRKRQEARLARKLKREQKRVEWKKKRDAKKTEQKKKREVSRLTRRKKWEEFKHFLKKDDMEQEVFVMEAAATELENDTANKESKKMSDQTSDDGDSKKLLDEEAVDNEPKKRSDDDIPVQEQASVDNDTVDKSKKASNSDLLNADTENDNVVVYANQKSASAKKKRRR